MNQNQYPNNYRPYQYHQQAYSQPVNPNVYGNAQQQPYPAQPWTQQPHPQQVDQVPVQQASTTQQQPNQALQPQQQHQWPQQYQQGIDPQSVVTSSTYPQAQFIQATPGGQWQTNTNTTTTTTQTTTTKKSVNRRETQQQAQNMVSLPTDFSKLMQQPPQQQQQQQQLQTATEHSYYTQKIPPPPPSVQTPSTMNFSHLMQAPPPPQQPAQPAALPPPAPPVKSPGSSGLRREIAESINSFIHQSNNTPPIPNPQPTNQASTSQTTTKTTTNIVGSTSRQQAAVKGERELKRFDQHVTAKLWMVNEFSGICPAQFNWYAVRDGYLCGGGNHFVTHEDIEAMLTTGRQPDIEMVNLPFERVATPPPGDGDGSDDEPIFWPNSVRVALGYSMLPEGEREERPTRGRDISYYGKNRYAGLDRGALGYGGLGYGGLGYGRRRPRY